MGQNESTPGSAESSLPNPNAQPRADGGHVREAADGRGEMESERIRRLQEELDMMRVMLSSMHDEGGEVQREKQRAKLRQQEERSQRAIYIRQRKTELEELKQSLEVAAASHDDRKTQRAREAEKAREEKAWAFYEKLRASLAELEIEDQRTRVRESLEEKAEQQREQDKRAKIADARARCSQLEEVLREANRRASERDRARKLELDAKHALIADGRPQQAPETQRGTHVHQISERGVEAERKNEEQGAQRGGEAAKSGGTAIPPHYQIRMSKTRGKPYYLNTLTGACTWEVPPEGAEEQDFDADVILWHSEFAPQQNVGGSTKVGGQTGKKEAVVAVPSTAPGAAAAASGAAAAAEEEEEEEEEIEEEEDEEAEEERSVKTQDGVRSKRKEKSPQDKTSGAPPNRGEGLRRGADQGRTAETSTADDATPGKWLSQVFDNLQVRDHMGIFEGIVAPQRGRAGPGERADENSRRKLSRSRSKSARGRGASKVQSIVCLCVLQMPASVLSHARAHGTYSHLRIQEPNKTVTKEITWDEHMEWIQERCACVCLCPYACMCMLRCRQGPWRNNDAERSGVRALDLLSSSLGCLYNMHPREYTLRIQTRNTRANTQVPQGG